MKTRHSITAIILASIVVVALGMPNWMKPVGAASIGSWTLTGSMAGARFEHGTALLQSGKVLVTGGRNNNALWDPSVVLASSELFDPSTGTWTPTGNLNSKRFWFDNIVSLNTGKVLIAGGMDTVNHIAPAELYDPSSGTWSYTGSLNTPRHNATLTKLNDGRVLIAGGSNYPPGDKLASAEIYDPNTGSWSYTGNMNEAREDQKAVKLQDGRVLVLGGATPTASASSSAEIYDPIPGTWSDAGMMSVGRQLASATLLLNGKVLVAGGSNSFSLDYASAEVYDPIVNTWTSIHSMNMPHINHTATLMPDGRVLVAGGGVQNGALVGSSEIYDPATDTWTLDASLQTTRGGQQAVLLSDSRVLIAGGSDSQGSALASSELYTPPDTTPPAAITDLKVVQGTSPGQVILTWTAPGDDGNSGTASSYVVGYMTELITPLTFWTVATKVSGAPTPQPDGTQQSMIVSGLEPGTTYYFAIVARDAAGNDGALSNSPSVTTRILPSWTIMIYLDGDNDLDPDYVGAFNQLESTAKNPDVNIIVVWDRLGNGNSTYYKVKYDTNPDGLANYTEGVDKWGQGELQMNNSTTLSNFIQWTRANYPAQHYALFISDHGNGLYGTAKDLTSGLKDNWLTIKGLGDALATATANGTNKIDVIFADSCFLAMIEDAYQIRNYANYYVASENEIFISGDHSSGAYANYISQVNASTSPYSLANSIVTGYTTWLKSANPNLGYTISVVDLSRINDLINAVNNLALYLKAHMASYSSQLSLARNDSQKFDYDDNKIINPNDQYVDLYDLAANIKKEITDPTVQELAQAVMDTEKSYGPLSMAKSGYYDGRYWNLSGSHGVSIFFPSGYYREPYYNGSNLDFAANTTWLNSIVLRNAPNMLVTSESTPEWGTMLVEYVKVVNPNALDDPNPPDLAAPLTPLQAIYLSLVWR